jgi:hypothetical protein
MQYSRSTSHSSPSWVLSAPLSTQRPYVKLLTPQPQSSPPQPHRVTSLPTGARPTGPLAGGKHPITGPPPPHTRHRHPARTRLRPHGHHQHLRPHRPPAARLAARLAGEDRQGAAHPPIGRGHSPHLGDAVGAGRHSVGCNQVGTIVVGYGSAGAVDYDSPDYVALGYWTICP